MAATAAQEKPLAPEEPTTPPRGPGAEPSSRYLRHRKCIICCGCATSTLAVLAILIVTLALTVFRVKNPTLTIDDVTIEGLEVSSTGLLRTDVNVTVGASVSIKNPNAASLRFSNFTTEIYYGGMTVGEARVPAGNARARRTMRADITAVVMAEKLAQAPGLAGDLRAGELEVGCYMVVKGRVRVLGIVKKHVAVAMNCSLSVDVKTEAVQLQHCSRHVSL